ncbi:MAG: NTP/NDP exchange transporter [Burkholderiales bacterium]
MRSGVAGAVGGTLARLARARPRELAASLWAFVYFFALLAGYYVLRPIRDEMAIQVGQRALSALFTWVLVAMLVIAPVFGALTARFPRKRLLPWLYAFFVVDLVAFFGAFSVGNAQSPLVASVFYVWVSAFNLFAVSLFWSFMADLFDTAQAKRLYGFIAAGGTVGALAGPALTALFVVLVGVKGMVLVSAAFLVLAIVAILRLRAWAEATGASPPARTEPALGGGVLAGITDILRSRYLLGICFFLFCFSLLSTFLYFAQTGLVPAAIHDSAARTRLFALVDLVVNLLALAVQVFAFGALIERLGTTFTLALMPALAVAGFALFASDPVLPMLVVLGVVRRAGEYAVSKPARETLFNVLPAAQKYKAKNVIDTVVHRGGDTASSWIFNGLRAAGVSLPAMAWMAVPVAALWWLGAILLGRNATAKAAAAARQAGGGDASLAASVSR